MRLQHTVDDERVQRLHHRQRDRHVVDRLEVRVAAVEVGDVRPAVLEVRRRHHVRARARDVQQHRYACLLAHRPHRIEARCDSASGRACSTARSGSPRYRRRSTSRASVTAASMSPTGNDRDGQQARVDRAPVEDGAVLRTRERDRELGIAVAVEAQDRRARERVEHELAREAEQVERLRTVDVEERTGRGEVLAQHELRLVLGAVLRVGVAGALLRRSPAGRVRRRRSTRTGSGPASPGRGRDAASPAPP